MTMMDKVMDVSGFETKKTVDLAYVNSLTYVKSALRLVVNAVTMILITGSRTTWEK